MEAIVHFTAGVLRNADLYHQIYVPINIQHCFVIAVVKGESKYGYPEDFWYY